MAQVESSDEQPADGGAPRPTRVVNLRHRRRDPGDPDHVYIGRANGRYRLSASKWKNPFKMRSEQERARVIEQYREYVLGERPDLVADLPELRGKTLYCWCAPPGGLTAADQPHLCHGQVLAELADALPDNASVREVARLPQGAETAVVGDQDALLLQRQGEPRRIELAPLITADDGRDISSQGLPGAGQRKISALAEQEPQPIGRADASGRSGCL